MAPALSVVKGDRQPTSTARNGQINGNPIAVVPDCF
jgi:hypothetical protein